MKCPHCGTENPAGKIVCRSCGARLRASSQAAVLGQVTEEELMTRMRMDLRRLAVVMGIVVIAGVLLGYLIR